MPSPAAQCLLDGLQEPHTGRVGIPVPARTLALPLRCPGPQRPVSWSPQRRSAGRPPACRHHTPRHRVENPEHRHATTGSQERPPPARDANLAIHPPAMVVGPRPRWHDARPCRCAARSRRARLCDAQQSRGEAVYGAFRPREDPADLRLGGAQLRQAVQWRSARLFVNAHRTSRLSKPLNRLGWSRSARCASPSWGALPVDRLPRQPSAVVVD